MTKAIKRLFLLSIILLSVAPSFSQTAEEYFELAIKKYQEEDYQYAKTLIEKSIALDSTDLWSWLFSATINRKSGEYRSALGDYDRALQIDSTEAEIYNRIADLFTSVNSLDQSIYFYDKAIHYAKSDTLRFNYLMNRASAKGILRDYEGAIKDMEAGMEIDPNNILILNNLPMFYQEVGQKEKAIQILKRSIELDPTFIGPMINLGLIYSEMDSLDQSEFYFDMAIKLDPKEPLLLNNRGYLFLKKKEYQKALRDINESINLYPSNSYAYRNRALTYIELGLIDEACRDLSIAEHYDFKSRFGDEVEQLIQKYCKKE